MIAFLDISQFIRAELSLLPEQARVQLLPWHTETVVILDQDWLFNHPKQGAMNPPKSQDRGNAVQLCAHSRKLTFTFLLRDALNANQQ